MCQYEPWMFMLILWLLQVAGWKWVPSWAPKRSRQAARSETTLLYVNQLNQHDVSTDVFLYCIHTVSRTETLVITKLIWGQLPSSFAVCLQHMRRSKMERQVTCSANRGRRANSQWRLWHNDFFRQSDSTTHWNDMMISTGALRIRMKGLAVWMNRKGGLPFLS